MRCASLTRRISTGLFVVALAGCTKAKLGDPTPNGITLSADQSRVTADGGAVTVHAQVFEDGVALLNQAVTFSIAGGVSAPQVVAFTTSTSGIATTTFTGLRTAGSGSIIATAGASASTISTSTPITVTPGQPSSLALTAVSQSLTADVGVQTFSTLAKDAFTNTIADAAIGISTDAPGAAVQGTQISNLHIAGSYLIRATVEGFPSVVDSAGFMVTSGAAAQVVGSLGQSAVGQASTLDIYCDEKDPFGNATGVTAGTVVTTNPASTVASAGGNHFTATAFPTVGASTATCSQGGRTSVRSFQVVAQSATNSIVASLNKTLIQAGAASTATLTCKKVDGYGNTIATTFTTANVNAGGSGAVITGANPFTLTGFTSPGIFEATCNDPGATLTANGVTFQVTDTIAPTITSLTVAASTGFPGVTPDGKYGPGTSVTFRATATDAGGIASESLGITGPASAQTASSHLESGSPKSTTTDFAVLVSPGATTFSTITIAVQITDRSGNSSASTISITVDPAAGFKFGTGVTSIRTLFERPTDMTGFPILEALVSTAGNFYVTENTQGDGEMIRIPATAGTAFTVVVPTFAMLPPSSHGLVHVAGGYGGHTIFQTVTGQVDSIDSGVANTFATAPTAPFDMIYNGVIGLAYSDANRIETLSSTGVSTILWNDSTNLGGGALRGLADLGTGNLLVGGINGSLFSVNQSTGVPTPFIGTNPSGGPTFDIVIGNSAKILLCSQTNTVDRLSSTGTNLGAVSNDFNAVATLALDASGNLYVGDNLLGLYRVYKVVGY